MHERQEKKCEREQRRRTSENKSLSIEANTIRILPKMDLAVYVRAQLQNVCIFISGCDHFVCRPRNPI